MKNFNRSLAAVTLCLMAATSANAANLKVKTRAPAVVGPATETATEGTEDVIGAKLVVDPNMEATNSTSGVQLASQPSEVAAAALPAIPEEALPKVDVSKLPENEIPVLATVKENKKSEGGQFGRLLATLGVLALLLGAASFGLKRWMKKTGTNKTNTRIKILTQHHLGPKKSLAIIQVAGESLLIGLTDQNITMLKTLSLLDDEVPETVPASFERAMNDFDGEEDEDQDAGLQAHDNFAVRGLSEIRDTVSTRSRRM